MGELKGQILGLLLVIILFGAVGAVVKVVFENSTADVKRQIQNTVTEILKPMDFTD